MTTYEFYESHDGSHWQHHRTCIRSASRPGVVTVVLALALLPIALLAALTVIIILPILQLADLIRKRER